MSHLPRPIYRTYRFHRLLAYMLSRMLAALLRINQAVSDMQKNHGGSRLAEDILIVLLLYLGFL